MSAIPAELKLASPWRTAGPAALALLAIILVLYRDTAIAMADVWSRSDTFAHGALVAPISLWLVWRKRAQLALIEPRPMPWMLLPMLAVASVWFAGDLIVVNAPTQFAFVTLIVLAVPAALGLQVARAILFPLLFLYFAVPFGEFMIPPMMEWTADFVVAALQFTGIPVHREGLNFIVPNGRWSVVEGCSGVRYLIASVMVGSLFAYLNYQSQWRRAAFIGFAFVVPIVANWFRAYLIVMVGYLSDNRIAAGVDHIIYGWVFFGIVIFVMFIVGMRWAEPQAAPAAPAGAAGSIRSSWKGGSSSTGSFSAMLGAAVVVVLLPHMVFWSLAQSDRAGPVKALPLAEVGSRGWVASAEQMESWKPYFGNPVASATQAFTGPMGTVHLHVAYFRQQNPESKLVSSQSRLVYLNDRQWDIESSRVMPPADATGATSWRRTTIKADVHNRVHAGTRITAWHAYWVDGQWVATDLQAKVANGMARLKGRGDDGAKVIVYTDVASATQADTLLASFLTDNRGAVQALLQRTRDSR